MFGQKTVIAQTREELNEALESGASEIVVRGDSELLEYAQDVASSSPSKTKVSFFSMPVIVAISAALAGFVSIAWFFLLASPHRVPISLNNPAAQSSNFDDSNAVDVDTNAPSTSGVPDVVENSADNAETTAGPVRSGAAGGTTGGGEYDQAPNASPPAGEDQRIIVQLAWPFIVALALSFMFILALVGMLRGWNVRWKWHVTSHASGELILSRGATRSRGGDKGKGRHGRET